VSIRKIKAIKSKLKVLIKAQAIKSLLKNNAYQVKLTVRGFDLSIEQLGIALRIAKA